MKRKENETKPKRENCQHNLQSIEKRRIYKESKEGTKKKLWQRKQTHNKSQLVWALLNEKLRVRFVFCFIFSLFAFLPHFPFFFALTSSFAPPPLFFHIRRSKNYFVLLCFIHVIENVHGDNNNKHRPFFKYSIFSMP